MTKHKAVLFDLDGTLLDTIRDLTESMNVALGRLGFAPHTVDECKYFVGDGVETYAQRALPEGNRDPATVTECVRHMRSEYAQRWDRCTKPYPGVPELLDELAKRGIARAVLSNKPHDFTLLCVQRLLEKWTFDMIQGVEPGVLKKPDPSGALAVAAKLGVPPAECLYVGDTNTDMQTARAAGMYAVGALWGFRTEEELLACGAQTLIQHPLELLKLL